MGSLTVAVFCFLVCFTTAGGVFETTLEKSANCFSLNLYKQIVYDRDSLVSSPFSLYLLLSLLRAGAGGHTAEELVEVLGYRDLSIADMQDAFKFKMDKLQRSGANTLTLANSVWVQEGYEVNNNFKAFAIDKFSAIVFSVDFEERPRQVREKVNFWVSSQTKGLIPTFTQKNFDVSTVMLLVNALYFKGQWLKRFNPKMTRVGTFHNHGSSVYTSQVHMMTQQAKFNYKYDSELKAEILELPYAGNNMSMIIFLPESHVKFEDFELALTCAKFENALLSGLSTVVDITMPVFELTSHFDLQSSLWQMGLQRIFDVSANLSGINKNVYVTKSVQNTVFSVSEEGSEGASVTAVVAGKRTISVPPDFVSIRLDRPFLFLIQHKVANLVLFIGRVTELPNS